MEKQICPYTDQVVVVSCYNFNGQCPCLNCVKNPRICDEYHCSVLEQHCIVPRGTIYLGLDGNPTIHGIPLKTPLPGKEDITYGCLDCLALTAKLKER